MNKTPLKSTQKIQEILFFLLILSNTFINLIGGSTGGNGYFYISCVIFFAYGLTVKFNFKFNFLIGLYSIIAILSFFSLVYAPGFDFVMEDLPRVLSNFMTLIIASTFVDGFKRLKKLLIFSVLCILFLAVPNLLWSTPGLREMYWGGVNPVGAMMFYGIVFSIILSFIYNKYFLIVIPVFIYVMILSQSQKVIFSLLIVVLVFLLLSLLLKGLSKYQKYIFILLIFGFVSSYLITNTKLGESFTRTQATLEEFQTGESVAGSAVGSGYRNFLLKKGYDYFTESPFFGHGLNQYRYLHINSTGVTTYSHNTWIELLVGFGIFVTIFYLIIYIKISKRLFSALKYEKNSLLIFLFSSLISVIIIGQFQKMYYDVFTHIFLLVILVIANFKINNRLNES